MKFGDNVLRYRKAKNLSQEQLAELIGVTRQTISNWELGETVPDMKQLIELSKTFDISIDELVNNDSKSILYEKLTNTEKLAGIIIKILKLMSVMFFIGLFLIIGVNICFTFFRNEPSDTLETKTLECSILDNNYRIIIGDKNYYSCENCSKEMNVYLKDVTDWANLEHSVKNVNTYFLENGGSCK